MNVCLISFIYLFESSHLRGEFDGTLALALALALADCCDRLILRFSIRKVFGSSGSSSSSAPTLKFSSSARSGVRTSTSSSRSGMTSSNDIVLKLVWISFIDKLTYVVVVVIVLDQVVNDRMTLHGNVVMLHPITLKRFA